MGKEENLKKELFQTIIHYVRENHADKIDKAYEYFWENSHPEEYMQGTALEIGFMNFEDWLVFDYKANEEKETFIDIYRKINAGLKKDEAALLEKTRDSILSLYEVKSISKDKRVLLADILLGEEFSLRSKTLTKGLKKGDLFATRLLPLDGGHVMSGCVYPYKAEYKKMILKYIDNQFGRYKRNVKSDGTMRDYLKDYGDVFNIVWINLILHPPEKKT